MKRLLLPFALLGCSGLFAQENTPEANAHRVAENPISAEETEMPHELWWKWANFAILAAGLGYLIAKNAGPFFASRSAEIQKGITEAAAVKAEAEARARDIESRISNLAGEVQQLRKTSQQEIAAEGARISGETTATVAKIQAQAQQEVASAVKNASMDLKAQAAELAMEIAEQQIRTRMTPDTQNTLISSFVQDLKHEAEIKAARN